jgi:hypothetical protein
VDNLGKRLRIGFMLALISVVSLGLVSNSVRAQDSQIGSFSVPYGSTVFIYNNLTGQNARIQLTVCVNAGSQPALVDGLFAVPVGGCRTARMVVEVSTAVGVQPSQAATGATSGTYQVRETNKIRPGGAGNLGSCAPGSFEET